MAPEAAGQLRQWPQRDEVAPEAAGQLRQWPQRDEATPEAAGANAKDGFNQGGVWERRSLHYTLGIFHS